MNKTRISFALGGAALGIHSQATGIAFDGRDPQQVADERDSAGVRGRWHRSCSLYGQPTFREG